jgi:hypothetical protein
MIYLDSKESIKIAIENDIFKNKRVLITFGDSWTNNTYLQNFRTYPKKAWAYQLAHKLNYDMVLNISWDGGSNVEIFEQCLLMMSLYEDYEFDKCKIKELGCAEIKVIIGWSSQIRDFSPIHKIFRPFNVTNIPYVHFGEDKILSKTYFKFIDKIMRKELYQYTTQVQIILLQEYFKNHNIDFYSFMAFTPLVENEFKNTEWDLREHIDSEKFYGLYSDINSMAQKLNSLINSNIKNEFVFDQPHYNNRNFISIFSKFFNKKKEYKDFLELQNKLKIKSEYHLEDGHPNELGLEVICNELFEMIDTYSYKKLL